jgi:hypothetical protein
MLTLLGTRPEISGCGKKPMPTFEISLPLLEVSMGYSFFDKYFEVLNFKIEALKFL